MGKCTYPTGRKYVAINLHVSHVKYWSFLIELMAMERFRSTSHDRAVHFIGYTVHLMIKRYLKNGVETMITYFYHSGFLDYSLHLYCYIHNVSLDIFFRSLSNSGAYTELRTTSFIESTGSLVLNSFTITGYKCQVFLYCYLLAVRVEPATSI